MNENEMKNSRVSEAEAGEEPLRAATEPQFEAATLPNGLETYVLKGTRVVSQVEEIELLNKRLEEVCNECDGLKLNYSCYIKRNEALEKELDETKKQNGELEARVEKLTEASKVVVKDCESRVERLQKLFESTSANARRLAEELSEARSKVSFWRLIAVSTYVGVVIGSVVKCVLQG